MRKVSQCLSMLILSLTLLVTPGWGLSLAKADDVPMVPANFSQLAEMARPGVVNIRTVRTIKGGGRVFRHFFGHSLFPSGSFSFPFLPLLVAGMEKEKD